MPALFFPNLDTLRLALASGLVPTALTSAPVRAALDVPHLWLEMGEVLPRETLTALGRFGIVAIGAPSVTTYPTRCWAELLPLRKAPPISGPVLFDVSEKYLTTFVSCLRRLRVSSIGVLLLPEPHEGRAWVTVASPPVAVLAWAEEPDSLVRTYQEQSREVWTARGWEHPLSGQLVVPEGCVLMCSPDRGVTAFATSVPLPVNEEVFLPRGTATASASAISTPARIELRLRLTRWETAAPESLWVLNPAEQDDFRAFCRGADERLLRRFEIATLLSRESTRLVVKRALHEDNAVPPVVSGGYHPDPRVPSLFVPTGYTLRPRTRAAELVRELGLSSDRVTWLEPTGAEGFATHAVVMGAFHPLCDMLEYSAEPASPLTALRISVDPFPFATFAVRLDPSAEPEPNEVGDEAIEEQTSAPTDGQPGWVTKSVGKMVRWVRGLNARDPADPSDPALAAKPVRHETRKRRRVEPIGGRVSQKLSSADALLHGHDRATRRQELENRLLTDFPKLGPDERAARWAELASVYGATGQSLDAAVCWVNASWECVTPPSEWLERWAEAECRATNRSDRSTDLDRWLAEPARPGTGRVVAALAARAGFQSTPAPEFIALLPRVLTVLEQHLDDIPVRGAWMARLAVARSCDGDVLGVAHWRDKLIHRLRDRGPGLDLDEPSFLRFRGPATAERFKTAREWLTRVKEPVLAWVQRHGGCDRMQWTGLEAETVATAGYAQFILAWGLGALGERDRARDWSARAHKALARAGGPRADPAAHALLSDLFQHRIKEAHEGHTPKPGLPAELRDRLDKLPFFARYSVDRLREHCRVLQPLGGVRGSALSLMVFWGTDRLGERLSVLDSHTVATQLNDEARELLKVAANEPNTSTVPRVVFALLEVAGLLEPSVLEPLLALVPAALDWMNVWVRPGRNESEASRAGRVLKYQKTMIDAAFEVAPAGATAVLLHHLTRGAAAGHLLAAATATAPRTSRAARKFGLRADAEALMSEIDPARAEWEKAQVTAERVGFAVGWFAAGDEDAANRILDAAREQLFLTAPNDLQDRTTLALAYAEALGFAPVGISLGRLEELFQRLDRVAVGGSTNCYFTLQPLRLIDTVVRSVVTDEFTLGAAVRAWLDEDEFLIRRRVHRDMAALLRESKLG